MKEEHEPKNWESGQANWTKRLFFLSFVLLGTTFLLQGIGVLQFPEQAKTKQKPVRAGGLRCDEPIWNFGSVDSVKKPRLSHEFVLVNESNETVTIKKIHSTCGCMVAEDYAKELTSGGSTKLRVVVDLPSTPGSFNKNLVVQTNKGVLPLNVVGEMEANSRLYCVPAKVNFGAIQRGETKERTVQLLRYDLSPVLFQKAEAPDGIACSLGETTDYRVMLNIRMTAELLPVGPFEGRVAIETAGANQSVFQIPVSAVIAETE